MRKKTAWLGIVLLFFPLQRGWAWGRTGHALIAETAAHVLTNNGKANHFLLRYSFDLGYYSNVPDLIWKKPATYEKEWFNHFMDLEIFNREISESQRTSAFSLDRKDFEKTYPKILQRAGRSFWRVREIESLLTEVDSRLKKAKGDEKQQLQEHWLVLAGIIAHYIGDLAQPLHCTENYDGQMTNQKGLHAFFEDRLVDELTPNINRDVDLLARSRWMQFHEKHSSKSSVELLRELAEQSFKDVPYLLKLDQRIGRNDIAAAKASYRQEIIDRLVNGSLFLAELWRRHINFQFDDTKFYLFNPTPSFIEPGNIELEKYSD